ncbi:MAG: hypothetical protein ACI814_003654 [Mariniblastus sp.]|jgi:hypothetical protein
MTRNNWLALLFLFSLFSVTVVWCYFEVGAMMETRGELVGFHPLVLLAVPAGDHACRRRWLRMQAAIVPRLSRLRIRTVSTGL